MIDFTSTVPDSLTPNMSAAPFLREIWQAVGGNADFLQHLEFSDANQGQLRSAFAVTDLAAASIGAAGLAIAEMMRQRSGKLPVVRIDRRLSSFWFQSSLRPIGWESPSLWDAIAGDYQCTDGWIRLHTNAPHHRDAALAVLAVPANKDAVAKAVADRQASELEAASVGQGGCAAAMRSQQEWAVHPQGLAVADEPLLHVALTVAAPKPAWANRININRPLEGIRVLDLTRVLAGPVATRFLAGYGADVLRIDSPTWDEPGVVPEVTLGKRLARVDLRQAEGRATLEALLRQADVLVHGYRPEALARLGFDAQTRRRLNPGLVDVCLDAYGWSGPWRGRRGFDSLVQMSSGIADAGMHRWNRDRPTPLPVQALDHATGYIMAAAVVRGLVMRLQTGAGSEIRTSLARTAALLTSQSVQFPQKDFQVESIDDLADPIELTSWGSARRLKAPVSIEGVPMQWTLPAGLLGSSPAVW